MNGFWPSLGETIDKRVGRDRSYHDDDFVIVALHVGWLNEFCLRVRTETHENFIVLSDMIINGYWQRLENKKGSIFDFVAICRIASAKSTSFCSFSSWCYISWIFKVIYLAHKRKAFRIMTNFLTYLTFYSKIAFSDWQASFSIFFRVCLSDNLMWKS